MLDRRPRMENKTEVARRDERVGRGEQAENELEFTASCPVGSGPGKSRNRAAERNDSLLMSNECSETKRVRVRWLKRKIE